MESFKAAESIAMRLVTRAIRLPRPSAYLTTAITEHGGHIEEVGQGWQGYAFPDDSRLVWADTGVDVACEDCWCMAGAHGHRDDCYLERAEEVRCD